MVLAVFHCAKGCNRHGRGRVSANRLEDDRAGFLAGLTQLFGGHETMGLVADNQWRMPIGQSIQAQCGILQHGMLTDQRQQLLRVKFT
jgi:hypothetical protein